MIVRELSACVKLPIRDHADPVRFSRIFRIGCNHNAMENGGAESVAEMICGIDVATVSADTGTLSCEEDADSRAGMQILLAVGARSADGASKDAPRYIHAYGVGIEFACARVDDRDSRGAARLRRTVCSELILASEFETEDNLIWMELNNEPCMEGRLTQVLPVIALVDSMISHGSSLLPGDLIAICVPQRDVPIKRGDILRGGMEGLAIVRLKIM